MGEKGQEDHKTNLQAWKVALNVETREKFLCIDEENFS